MKRNAFDVLRRGFENAVANWPLLLIRVAEMVVLALLVVGAVIAAIIPVLVSAGLSRFDLATPETAAQLVVTLFVEHWILIVYLLVLVTLILGVLIAVHSFVEAGSAQVYVDGEHAPDLRAFAIDRWLEGGRKGWWAVFWIYNAAWSIGALILLIPLLVTILGMILITETGGRLAIGCAGLALTVLLMIPVGIAIGMWTQKAIAICMGRALGAAEALGAARREIRLDFGRHLAVMLLLIVISFVAAGLVSGFSIPFSIGSHSHRASFLPIFFAPVQIVLSVVQNAISAAVGAWSLASFVALTEE